MLVSFWGFHGYSFQFYKENASREYVAIRISGCVTWCYSECGRRDFNMTSGHGLVWRVFCVGRLS